MEYGRSMIPLIHFPDSFPVIAHGLRIRDLLSDQKGKLRPSSIFALHLDLTAHHLQQSVNDGHAKTGSFDMSVLFLLNARKRNRQLIQILRLDANSRILYGYKNIRLPVLAGFQTNRKSD